MRCAYPPSSKQRGRKASMPSRGRLGDRSSGEPERNKQGASMRRETCGVCNVLWTPCCVVPTHVVSYQVCICFQRICLRFHFPCADACVLLPLEANIAIPAAVPSEAQKAFTNPKNRNIALRCNSEHCRRDVLRSSRSKHPLE